VWTYRVRLWDGNVVEVEVLLDADDEVQALTRLIARHLVGSRCLHVASDRIEITLE
jgi:hypothetical protein